MKMEPVFADEVGDYPDSSLAPGSVRVTPRKQQLIGVRLATVEKEAYTHTLRALGRVAVDERLIYRLNSAVDGWIREVGNNSTGGVVKKGETLATFYSPLFLSAQQAYIYALGSVDRYQTLSPDSSAQSQLNRAGIQQNVDSLRNLGMSEQQVMEIGKSRQFTENIRLVAPATSFVLARNISPGQRFDKGAEWFRLADLSRVWVVVDLYENEAGFIRPGERVTIRHPYQKKARYGVVSDVLPQFDPTSRTLKVRLEVENTDFALRPDMFMDVDFPVTFPETVSVPADAVLDSGIRKTVFVDRGEGFFEPRSVETGWRLGDRVQILKGLEPGEKIVVSGNFLIDSESRMKLAAAGLWGDVGSDAVCSKPVDERKAGTEGRSSRHQGKAYFFCSEACKQQFDQDPGRYAGPVPGDLPVTAKPPAPEVPGAGEPVVAAPPPGWQPPVIAPVPPAMGAATRPGPGMPLEPKAQVPAAPGSGHPAPEPGHDCHETGATPAHQAPAQSLPAAQGPVPAVSGATPPPCQGVTPEPQAEVSEGAVEKPATGGEEHPMTGTGHECHETGAAPAAPAEHPAAPGTEDQAPAAGHQQSKSRGGDQCHD
jgi:RND family efflux transporter MFP subunit